MQQQDNKAVTALVRSMKRNLEKQHGIVVPHAALRACYLQALGEHPHAFAGSNTVAQMPPALVKPQDAGPLRTLYLVEDEQGCLARLALDEDGMGLLPEDFLFKNARLQRQFAEVPRVVQYGLPDYLANAREFYGQFGLKLANTYEHDYKDLGDDSGDTCRIIVTLPEDEWCEALRSVLKDNPGFEDTIAEWAGLHHHVLFDRMALDSKIDWVQRYLDSLAETILDADDEPEAAPQHLDVKFEWLYPDQDSDSVAATLDLETGTLSFEGNLPSDVTHPSVGTRIWVPNEGDTLDEAYDGTMYDAMFSRNAHGGGSWIVERKVRAAILAERTA